MVEYIFTYPKRHNKADATIHYWCHPIDTVFEKDRLRGMAASELFNLDSEQAQRQIRSLEDFRPIY